MIKAIIFDFGQTLVDSADGFRQAEKDIQYKIFKDLDLPSWEEYIDTYRKIRGEFKSNSNFSRVLMWTKVYSNYNRLSDEVLLKQWENEYWENVINNTKPFPETISTLAKLHEKYSLGVITNTQGQGGSLSHRISLFPEIEKYLDELIIAGESNIPPKPATLPFNMCLEKLNITKDQAIYVGDDLEIDIIGAIRAGISPVWLKHYSVKRNWPVNKITVPVITSLDKLLNSDFILKNHIL
jgi:putative hydrolase of the HAD superfamily